METCMMNVHLRQFKATQERKSLKGTGEHLAFWVHNKIAHSYCVSVSRKRLCVSVFDSIRTLAATLMLVVQDTSPLLWEKADGEPAL